MSKDVSAPEEERGYYRYPTLAGDQVVFVSEDDLWTVDVDGGIARRLTSGLGKVTSPALSHDGRWLAFTSTEEGHSEVYLMPAEGGEPKRMTFLGCETRVVGWTRDGEILFASNHQHAFARLTDVYSMTVDRLEMRRVPCGPATHLDIDGRGRKVVARHGGTDLAYWKRYRGGLAGELWIDRGGKGKFAKLFKKPKNSARPYWAGDRIVFISDHEGMGNVYSISASEGATDLRRHSDCREYYARGLCVDGQRAVFHAGGDLFLLDLEKGGEARRIPIAYRSPRTQINRRFVSASRFLEDCELHPNGDRAVIAARGKTFSFDLWKGPVFMHGGEPATRYRLGRFMNDGKRIVLVSDSGGEESLEIHDSQNRALVERLDGLDLGRCTEMKISPASDEALVVNHRNELIWIDLVEKKSRVLDRSHYAPLYGFNWSPDGRYVAYSCSESHRSSAIRICEIATGEITTVTRPVLRDTRPFFDPSGEYLYFLSYREFDPVYDNLQFDLGFPRGCRPYLLTLRKDVLSPFSADHPGRSRDRDRKDRAEEKSESAAAEGKSEKVPRVEIDFDGIADRIVAFPLPDGRYGQIAATKDKVFFTRLPIKGSLQRDFYSSEPVADASLEMFDPETQRTETIVNNITGFRLSQDGKYLVYRAGNSLRVLKAGEKPPGRDADDYRRGGWLDLDRVQIPVLPRDEWRQMYREAWRLQRDHFWTEDMSKVDWTRVFARYHPLLERVGSRSEVSDVIWEMQGELGTSHAYEIGGDYRPNPHFGMGFLGAEWDYDESEDAFVLKRVMKGDVWDESASSPLARAGVGLKGGDYLIAIDGQPLGREIQPQQCLVHRAGKDVSLTFRRHGWSKPQTLSVRTLRSEQKLRYREWVERNRAFVHSQGRNRIGYVHIPNMGPHGYAEFHRAFLTELDREGLVIDVRFNGGGHVSQLLLEKLARRRIGYSKSRWFGLYPFPEESPAGAMVALTNEYAGSDGDIFSHSFKLLKLGPLIGKRTWGGVIGISPSHSLIDGGYTTQPEYSFWFADVGWKVENYGADPDIEVDFPPADYVAGRDPQLERALKVCLEQLDRASPKLPSLEEGPDLSLPSI